MVPTIAIAKSKEKWKLIIATKSNNYSYCDSWKSDNYRKRNKQRSKEIILKIRQKIWSDKFTRSNRLMFKIAIALLAKKKKNIAP